MSRRVSDNAIQDRVVTAHVVRGDTCGLYCQCPLTHKSRVSELPPRAHAVAPHTNIKPDLRVRAYELFRESRVRNLVQIRHRRQLLRIDQPKRRCTRNLDALVVPRRRNTNDPSR